MEGSEFVFSGTPLRLLALSAVAACTAFAGSALAQSQPYEQIRPESQGWTVDLGAGVLYRNDSNGDTGSKTTVAPWISANYRDIVYLTPIDGLGWNAIKTDDFRAGLQLRPRFSADDIEGLTLDRPGFGADLAAYAYKRLPGNVVVGGAGKTPAPSRWSTTFRRRAGTRA